MIHPRRFPRTKTISFLTKPIRETARFPTLTFPPNKSTHTHTHTHNNGKFARIFRLCKSIFRNRDPSWNFDPFRRSFDSDPGRKVSGGRQTDSRNKYTYANVCEALHVMDEGCVCMWKKGLRVCVSRARRNPARVYLYAGSASMGWLGSFGVCVLNFLWFFVLCVFFSLWWSDNENDHNRAILFLNCAVFGLQFI